MSARQVPAAMHAPKGILVRHDLVTVMAAAATMHAASSIQVPSIQCVEPSSPPRTTASLTSPAPTADGRARCTSSSGHPVTNAPMSIEPATSLRSTTETTAAPNTATRKPVAMIEFGIVRSCRSLMAALAAIVSANPSSPISARPSKTATSAEAADPLTNSAACHAATKRNAACTQSKQISRGTADWFRARQRRCMAGRKFVHASNDPTSHPCCSVLQEMFELLRRSGDDPGRLPARVCAAVGDRRLRRSPSETPVGKAVHPFDEISVKNLSRPSHLERPQLTRPHRLVQEPAATTCHQGCLAW